MSNSWNPPGQGPEPTGPGLPGGPPAGPPPGPPAATYGQPGAAGAPIAPVESTPSRRRGRGKVIAAAIAVVAVGAAAVFAVNQGVLGGDSEPTGAASPDELGERTLEAFQNSDAIGAAELLLPGERRAISDPAFDMIEELERLEVLSDVNLEDINGVDVILENEEVDVVETSVDDIVHLNISADATVEVTADELPTGPLLDDVETSSSTTEEPFDIQLVGVLDDGEWYLSIFYFAAEQARQTMYDSETGEMPEIPTASDGVTPNGADSPEGAIENVLSALEDTDLEAVIAGIDPGEASALQRYAPLFLDDAQTEFDEADLSISVTEQDFRVEGDGDQREVFIEALGMEIEAEGDSAYVQYADGCISVEANGEEDKVCFTGDEIEAELDNALEDFNDPEPIRELIDSVTTAFENYELPGIVVTEVDGEWFLSPIGSFNGLILSLLEALDADELEDIIEKTEAALESMFSLDDFDDFEIDDLDDIDDIDDTEVSEPGD